MNKPVLDACCGARMFWFDKADSRTTFMDKRRFIGKCCDGRSITVDPDLIADFTCMPFCDCSFHLIVFDPPHMRAGAKSWTSQKYGRLDVNWREWIRAGFSECFRVLRPGGTLIFKWNECHILVSDILALTPEKPLFGNRCGKSSKFHWIVFMKLETGVCNAQ